MNAGGEAGNAGFSAEIRGGGQLSKSVDFRVSVP